MPDTQTLVQFIFSFVPSRWQATWKNNLSEHPVKMDVKLFAKDFWWRPRKLKWRHNGPDASQLFSFISFNIIIAHHTKGTHHNHHFYWIMSFASPLFSDLDPNSRVRLPVCTVLQCVQPTLTENWVFKLRNTNVNIREGTHLLSDKSLHQDYHPWFHHSVFSLFVSSYWKYRKKGITMAHRSHIQLM